MNNIPLYLLHGWAANNYIFNELCHYLSPKRAIIRPDLAGHGANVQVDFDVMDIAMHIGSQLPETAYLFGWSLGGVVALHIAALYPHKIKKLILCSSFAKFYASEDYLVGSTHRILDKMADLFQQDYSKHMRQFLELQLLHSSERHRILQTTLPKIVEYGTPVALYSALNELNHVDARPLLNKIHAPTLLIYGNKDTLTPVRMGEYLEKNIANSQLHVIDKAAHAPFLSHAPTCAYLINDFLDA